jgi:hypothetical protein
VRSEGHVGRTAEIDPTSREAPFGTSLAFVQYRYPALTDCADLAQKPKL